MRSRNPYSKVASHASAPQRNRDRRSRRRARAVLGQDGLIDELTVMVRPRSAALALAEATKAELGT
jgi:hypothetical protein